MKTVVHINRHIIATNRKHGRDAPPLTVATYKGKQRGHRVRFMGPAEVIYDPEHPLPCGATAWIETQDPVEVVR